jgi:two-component system, OmpR family, KDP operon response regulator KdpE
VGVLLATRPIPCVSICWSRAIRSRGIGLIGDEGSGILIVDRDPDRLDTLIADLEKHGCTTISCRPVDLPGFEVPASVMAVVLGPGLSPLEVCNFSKEIRALVTCPLLVLADKTSPDFLAIALDAGSDACLVAEADKSARLILSAIGALERRDSLRRPIKNGVVETGHLQVDLVRRTASLGAAPLHLTDSEFDVLATLVQHPGRVMSAMEILNIIHGHRIVEREAREIVKLHVTRLRQKLGSDPWLSRCIASMGKGDYMYTFERRGELLVLDAVLQDDERDALSSATLP